jgi:hypothetical protein
MKERIERDDDGGNKTWNDHNQWHAKIISLLWLLVDDDCEKVSVFSNYSSSKCDSSK